MAGQSCHSESTRVDSDDGRDPMLKTIFFGTPETAVPFLRLLAKRTEVLAVVSQPDRPAGRGLEIAPTPVKTAALELGLKLLQPSKPSEIAAELKALGAD